MRRSKSEIPGFENPTGLPKNAMQKHEWQEQNRVWWDRNPMRYDWKRPIEHEEFSDEFYREIDKRFFDVLEEYMPWKMMPFDSLIDFGSLKGMDVLEIGVGNGSQGRC